MSYVMTVEGPIEPEALGWTSAHEHALIDSTGTLRAPASVTDRALALAPVEIGILGSLRRNPFFLNVDNCRLYDADTAVDELRRFRMAGGTSIIDLTNRGLGQDPLALRGIAIASGVRIVAGCGFYTQATHPYFIAEAAIEEIYDEIVADITKGIMGTPVRAGIIGEIGTSEAIHPHEEKVLRAAARAQRDTGVSANIHTYLFAQRALEALDVFESEGANLSRLIVSHVDHGSVDLEYQRAILERGAVVEYDGFGNECYVDVLHKWFARDSERLEGIQHLIEEGFVDQILLACDVCEKIQLTRYGGWGYEHLPRNVVPMMRSAGITEDSMTRMFVENPKRLLTIDGSP